MNPQAEHQPPPPHPQQTAVVNEQTAVPVVLVNQVQQYSDRQHFLMKHPYYRRGVLFSNGCRCAGWQIMMLITMGGVSMFMGIVVFILTGFNVIFTMIFGGACLGVGVFLFLKAKAQYNALPPDHPDRIDVTQNVTQRRGDQLGFTYTTVPSMRYPSPPAGQVMYYPSQPGLRSQPYPLGQSTTNAPSVPLIFGRPVPPGAGASYVPENDPPPAYSDVVKETYRYS